MGEPGTKTYWDGFAEGYAQLGPPLTPAPEDAALALAAIAEWSASHPGRAPRAILLGVTPGMAQLQFPANSWLTAIDQSAPMTRWAWPGNVSGQRSVVRGNWLALPFQDRSCDLVLGDAAMNCLRFETSLPALATEVRRVLEPEGLFILRCFAHPPVKEDPAAVVRELHRHPSFHHFKLRLMMALQPSAECGMPVHDVYRYWTRCDVDRASLAAQTGWSRESIDTIELHRGPNTVHTFPTLAEFQAVLSKFFSEISVSTPSYFLGESCPTLVLRP